MVIFLDESTATQWEDPANKTQRAFVFVSLYILLFNKAYGYLLTRIGILPKSDCVKIPLIPYNSYYFMYVFMCVCVIGKVLDNCLCFNSQF